MVSGNIKALEDSLGTYGHRNGAGAHFGTGRVPTHRERNGAREHMGIGMVPGHMCAL